MEQLSGKTAVVTGGASGIGKEIARAMVAEGMNVVIADIEAARLAAAAEEIGAVGVVTDVAKAQSVEALAKAAVDRFGTVHVLCNNAGIGPMASLEKLTLNDWRWMIDVNLWGVIHGITIFLPILRANSDGGHIVNTASMAGLMPVPTLVTYCTAKYGIVGMSESMALDLEREGANIGVSILCPGPVRTDLGSSTRNRPDGLAGGLADVLLEDAVQFEDRSVNWQDPAVTAGLVIRGIRNNERYIITHPDRLVEVEARHRAIEQAFRDEDARRAR